MLVSRNICLAGCCIPCPPGKLFFPKLYGLFEIFNIVELISLFTLIMLVVSYMVLPRSHSLTSPVAAGLILIPKTRRLLIRLAQLIGLTFIQGGELIVVPSRTWLTDRWGIHCRPGSGEDTVFQCHNAGHSKDKCALRCPGILPHFRNVLGVLDDDIETPATPLTSCMGSQSCFIPSPEHQSYCNDCCTIPPSSYAATSIPRATFAKSAVILGLLSLFLGLVDFSTGQRCGPTAGSSGALLWWPLGVVNLISLVLHCWTCIKIVRVYRKSCTARKDIAPYSVTDPEADDIDLLKTSRRLDQPKSDTVRAVKVLTGSLTETTRSRPNSDGFWQISDEPRYAVDLELHKFQVDDESVGARATGTTSTTTSSGQTATKGKHMHHISEVDEEDRPEPPRERVSSHAQLTPQQLRQQREILARIRPALSAEERRDSLIKKLWRLNWRSAKLTLVGSMVAWIYAINSLVAIDHQRYVKQHPELVIAWAECVGQHGAE